MKDELSFKLGENIGSILLEIAQNKISSGIPQEAFKIYLSSLPEFTKEYVICLLKNELVLVVNEDKVSLVLSDNEELLRDNKINIIDWNHWVERKLEGLTCISDSLLGLRAEFDEISGLDINNYALFSPVEEFFGDYASDIGLHNIAAKLIAGDKFSNLYSSGENVWEKVKNKISLGTAKSFEKILFLTVEYVNMVKELAVEYLKLSDSYRFLMKYGLITIHVPFVEEILEKVLAVLDQFFSDPDKGYSHPMCNKDLKKFKKDTWGQIITTEIGKEWSENRILQKNIEDDYEAGWISPEGSFYGMRKGTTRLIHMTIAEQLYEGLFKEAMSSDGVSLFGGINCPEYWLDSKGWVRIHLGEVRTGLNCKLTQKQLESLIRYGKQYGYLRVNGKFIKISDFKNMDDLMRNQLFQT